MKFLILLSLVFISFTLFASEDHDHHEEHHHHDEHDELAFEEHSVHTHGQANAGITYVDDTLIIRLTLASKDIFGFEHIPHNEQETETVVSNLLYLEDFNNVLTTDPACAVQNATVDSEILPLQDHTDSTEIEHSDVKVTYELHCSANIKLTFTLLEKYSSIEKIAVQYVSSNEQHTHTVTHDNRTITLHK